MLSLCRYVYFFWIIQMSRYVNKQLTVSQEGFFGSLGKFLASAGEAYSRNVAIGSITFKPGNQPEVNGIPQKSYQQLVLSINNAVASGELWDLTLISGQRRADDTISWSTLVIVGVGRDIRVRLPGYNNVGYAPQVANLLIVDIKLKQIA